jgi:hypothetical protein
MMETDGCNKVGVEIPTAPDGEMEQIPYGKESWWGEGQEPTGDRRCHDCHCAVGKFHHPGCDMEQCPKCQGQLIVCGCTEATELN